MAVPVIAGGDGSEISDSVDGLPPLREDVRLHQAKREAGAPGWVLEDPANNCFFRIGWVEFEILSRWSRGDATAIVDAVNSETTLTIDQPIIDGMVNFLAANGLLRLTSARILEQKKRQGAGLRRLGPGAWLSQHVLFMRFPIFRPQQFLRVTTPFVAPLFSAKFISIMLLALVLALYLLGRQWQSALEGLATIYSLEGALASGLALIIAKSLHELSHAWSASRHGVPVPVMGVALLLFWPVLYTETSGAWLLKEAHKRAEIAAAGVAAEMVLAIAALLLWSFMDDGPARNAMIFAATTLLVMTLVFNANPLMKFDGYFVLVELCGIENLQARALGLLQWGLRRWLVGLEMRTPEPGFSRRRTVFVGLYGAALAIYRVLLYSGIVYALYLMTWPILAVPMAIAIIATFIIRPILVEIMAWFSLARRAGRPFTLLRTVLVVGLFVLPFVVPWRSTVVFSAVMHDGEVQQIFASEAGQVVRVFVRAGDQVAAGALLAEIISPDIEQQLSLARFRVAMLTRLIDRRLTQVGLHDDIAVRERERVRLQAKVEALEARHRRLELRTPSAGEVRFRAEALSPGVWISPGEPLIEMVSAGIRRAIGYIDERDLGAISLGAPARLWFDGLPGRSEQFQVAEINAEAVSLFDEPMLAALHGGPVPVRRSAAGGLVPERGLYRVMLVPDIGANPVEAARAGRKDERPRQKARVFVHADGPARSLAGMALTRIIAVWRREFG